MKPTAYSFMCTKDMGSAESRKEVLIIKTTVHDIMNKMIQVRMFFLLVFLGQSKDKAVLDLLHKYDLFP